MKIINSTDWPVWFLRRMVAWCCGELGIKVKKIQRFKLRNRSDGFSSGHCYSGYGLICVSLGVVNWTTALGVSKTLKRGDEYRRRTVDDLVRVTAHEVAHRMQHIEGSRTRVSRRYGSASSGGSEPATKFHEDLVMKAWDDKKETLYPQWMQPPARQAKSTINIIDARAAKAQADLAKWTRKLKLAQAKVKKLKVRVRYYAKATPRPVSDLTARAKSPASGQAAQDTRPPLP